MQIVPATTNRQTEKDQSLKKADRAQFLLEGIENIRW